MLDNETKFWCDCHPLRDNPGSSINQLLSFCQRNFVILCQEQNRGPAGRYFQSSHRNGNISLFASSGCTCPLLTLSSTLFHSWMLDDGSSHLIGGQSSLLWYDWLTPDPRSLHDPVDWPLMVCVQSVTMCVSMSGVPCTSHPRPCHYPGGDQICRASCNMSPANQTPGLVSSDQWEPGSASHIAWEAAVITINNNVLIRDPGTRRLNNSSVLATPRAHQKLWPHSDKMWRKVSELAPVLISVFVLHPPPLSLSLRWRDTESTRGWQDDRVCGQDTWDTWPRVSWLSSSSPSPRYWSEARQVRHGRVGE